MRIIAALRSRLRLLSRTDKNKTDKSKRLQIENGRHNNAESKLAGQEVVERLIDASTSLSKNKNLGSYNLEG
jgi:hypothetical protein